ncbi:MAG: DUF4258 domain-containing protein, partial [Candidatus Saliniplasma sp.]
TIFIYPKTINQYSILRAKMRITEHARKRMERYNISETMVRNAMKDPESLIDGHSGRNNAQKKLNGYVLRVIFEEEKGINVIVTVYKAKSERYEV